MAENMNTKPKKKKSRLLEISGTKKILVIFSITLSSLASICSFIPYISVYMVIKLLIGTYPDFTQFATSEAFDYGLLAVLGVTGNVLLYFGALCLSHLAAFGTLYELRLNFSSHLAKIPLGLHSLLGSGRIRKIMDENIEKIEGFIAHQLPDLVSAIVSALVMVVILCAVNWKFGLASLVGILVAFAIQIVMYADTSGENKMQAMQKKLEDMNNSAVEYIRGISVVKAFRQTVYSFGKLKKVIHSYTELILSYTLGWKNQMSLFNTVINNIYLFVVFTGILIGMNTTNYTGFLSQWIFYLLFVPSIATMLMKIMYMIPNLMRVVVGINAMDEILNKPELTRPNNPKTVENFDLCFENVVFSYTSDTIALNGISFKATQGKITAIVGHSGGGKSTIAHLIPRFFDVTEGKITIGSVDLRDMEPEYLMKQVSFVFQDVFLFKQSVRENISIGNAKATEEEIIKAAKSARCHDFIMKLPNGYNTIIGTKGVHLSGGEKQRIAIARAIVKDAPIIVLDEATAFSDPENEYLIQKAFEKLIQGKTVIMIAHRLSTIRSADSIVVVLEGKIVEQGTHDELLHKKGNYYEMWKTYTTTSSWKITTVKGVVR